MAEAAAVLHTTILAPGEHALTLDEAIQKHAEQKSPEGIKVRCDDEVWFLDSVRVEKSGSRIAIGLRRVALGGEILYAETTRTLH